MRRGLGVLSLNLMTNKKISLKKTNNFWLDAGLAGLMSILETELLQKNWGDIPGKVWDLYIPGTAAALVEKHSKDYFIKMAKPIYKEIADGFEITGNQEAIVMMLGLAYGMLILNHYDVPISDRLFAFYYSENMDHIMLEPVKKPLGAAGMIYANRPVITNPNIIAWQEKTKKGIPQVDEAFSYLQKDINRYFKSDIKLKIDVAGIYYGPSVYRPKINLLGRKTSHTCVLCGSPKCATEPINQTIFPFSTGNNGGIGFNSECREQDLVCWKCALLAKFVPCNSFYSRHKSSLFLFVPVSTSIKTAKIKGVNADRAMLSLQEDGLIMRKSRNFKVPTEYYIQDLKHPDENFFIFMATFYQVLKTYKEDKKISSSLTDGLRKFAELIFCDSFEQHSKIDSLDFMVITSECRKTAYSTKSMWLFQNTVFIMMLFSELEKSSIDIKKLLTLLVDPLESADRNTLLRNQVCHKILRRQPIIDLIEMIAWKHELSTDIFQLFKFAVLYENLIGSRSMTKNDQQVAVKLGKRIGMLLRCSSKSNWALLYSLRRTRSMTDFLEQVNRLQFKLDLFVPADMYNGSLTETNFKAFKQFCLLAALNSCRNIEEGGEFK